MASPQAGDTPPEPVQSTQLDPLDAMVELAQICHFCGTFQAPLKLPHFSRTDLQAALVAGTAGDDRQVALLAEVHFKLVREQGAKIERMIQDWERAVTRKVTDNWRLEFSSNPFDGVAYDDLTVAQRIQVLNALCHWKLESCAEIQKYLTTLQKEPDPKALEALRATPIGYDDAGSAYWYFGDCCWVYAEDRPEWQSQGQQYIVEFADAKRIRLSINFDPTRSPTSRQVVQNEVTPPENGDIAALTASASRDKMQITALVDEQIDEDVEEDEPLPIKKAEEPVHEEIAPKQEPATTVAEPAAPEKANVHSRKMDITMLCGSPATANSPPKLEPMEEDEHDVSEDRFMSTIVSTKDPVKAELHNVVEKVKEEHADPKPIQLDNGTLEQASEPEMKKRRLSEEHVDTSVGTKSIEVGEVAPTKRRKTRFHDIIRVSDNTTQPLAVKHVDSLEIDTEVKEPSQTPEDPTASANATDGHTTANENQDQDFDINCAACQRSYDRRYLDPPLDKRPVGEWRCFECLVNDARGWPRRRNPTKSPKGGEASEEIETTSSRRRSSSSSKRSSSKSTSSSSKGSSKRKSSSRSSSSSHKKGSSSKKSSKKHKKSSSSKHHSSSRHHHSRHRDEFAKLLKLAQGRKRERLAIEEVRWNGAHLCPVSLDGPSGWRVVCCSVEGLRQVIEKLAGGSLEQDRLRGRLISILKVEEKMEAERLKKREQQMWQVLPRRQSSRVAMGRIKNQHSGDSASDSEDEHDSSRTSQRASRSRRGSNGHESRDRLARDRDSRARRRRLGEGSESDSGSDRSVEPSVRSVNGWINWANVKGDSSLVLVCSGMINRLLKEEISELFSRPVDPEEDGCPDYLSVIEHPMDLGTIHKRVQNGFYTTWEPFKADVELVWKNCRQYNSPETVVVEYANALDEMFKLMRKEAERNGVRKIGKADTTTVDNVIDGNGEDDDLDESSDDEGAKGKSKSDDSSASEISSDESDDSSDASSEADDDEEPSGKRKTRNRALQSATRPSRASSRPARPPRTSAAPTRSARSSKRKSKDSESEEEADSSESEKDDDVELESDESEGETRGRDSRSRPRRGSQTRPEKRASFVKSCSSSSPPAEAAQSTDQTKSRSISSRRNRVAESSDSSSSEASFNGNDSSSSSDSDDVRENGKVTKDVSRKEASDQESNESASAPPPPASPPPPPPPSSAATAPPGSGRKPKAPTSAGRGRTSSIGHGNSYDSPASSSSYFSSSESDSSAGGSDSSDSD